MKYFLLILLFVVSISTFAQEGLERQFDKETLQYLQGDSSFYNSISLFYEASLRAKQHDYINAQALSDSALTMCPKEGINALVALPGILYTSGYYRIKNKNYSEGREVASYGLKIWWNTIQNDNLSYMYKPIREGITSILDVSKNEEEKSDTTNYSVSYIRSESLRIWLRATEKMDSLGMLSKEEGVCSEEFEAKLLDFVFATSPGHRDDPKLTLSTTYPYLKLIDKKTGGKHSKMYGLIMETMLMCCAKYETKNEAMPIYRMYLNDDSIEKEYQNTLAGLYEGKNAKNSEKDSTLTESIDPLEDQRQMDILNARVNRVIARAKVTLAFLSKNPKEFQKCDSLMQSSLQSLSSYQDLQTLKESVRLLTELSCFRIRYYKEMALSISEAAGTFNEVFPFLNKCFNNQVSKEHAALFYADMHLMADAKKWDQVVSIGEKLKELYKVWDKLPTVKQPDKSENVYGDKYNYPIAIAPLTDVNNLLVKGYLNYKGEKDSTKIEETYASFLRDSKQKVINDVKSNKFLFNSINVLLQNTVYLSKQLESDLLKTAAFENAVLLKGLKYYSGNLVKLMVTQGDNSTDNDTYERYTILNRLVLDDSQEKKEYTDSITKELKIAELLLYSNSSKYGDFIKSLSSTIDDIDKHLPEKSCLIEFVEYSENKQTNLVALLKIKGYKNIIDVNLGTIEVPQDITKIYYSDFLYRRFWEPIISKLPSFITCIYFSPIGVVNSIGIENALCSNGKYISDKFEIYRLTNSREIFNKQSNRKKIEHIALFGDIDYGGSNGNVEKSQPHLSDIPLSKVRDALKRGSIREIEPLEGTKIELRNISDILGENAIKYTVYSGKDASEENLYSLSNTNISQLHIASHGYFAGTLDVINNTSLDDSGLLFAGAENTLLGEADLRKSSYSDGVLKASEIATMNFHNLDLVTLSACETALGHISSEGVFGLQRGFKIAGANSILMSLWKVDDAATCKLMTEFYSNWIGKKMTKHKALEAAKKTVRETKGWEDPKYWAAFILLDGLD